MREWEWCTNRIKGRETEGIWSGLTPERLIWKTQRKRREHVSLSRPQLTCPIRVRQRES